MIMAFLRNKNNNQDRLAAIEQTASVLKSKCARCARASTLSPSARRRGKRGNGLSECPSSVDEWRQLPHMSFRTGASSAIAEHLRVIGAPAGAVTRYSYTSNFEFRVH
jgi:hypothetical protein